MLNNFGQSFPKCFPGKPFFIMQKYYLPIGQVNIWTMQSIFRIDQVSNACLVDRQEHTLFSAFSINSLDIL